jgi:Fe-S cluster assembly protein SufD
MASFAQDLSVLPSLPPGVRLGNLATALAGDTGLLERHLTRHAAPETTPFAALNTAFIRDGALVYVPVDTALDRPVHLLFVTSPDAGGTVAHPRNLIIVERGAKASVVESYVSLAGGATYFTNAVTEVVSGENAWTEHTRIQRESERAYHVGLTHVDQARAVTTGLSRLPWEERSPGTTCTCGSTPPAIETLMYGLYLTHGDQLVDNHTAIYHDHPECNSWEVYKGVLDDRSRAVFNGKVFVKPEAQKTDAKQTNRNLLLSSGAKVEYQTPAGDLCRRRQVYPWRDRRLSGSRGALLPAERGFTSRSGAEGPDLRVCRRSRERGWRSSRCGESWIAWSWRASAIRLRGPT